MGIPNYFSYIIKKYNQILKKNINFHVDNLYIDSNSIIYDALHHIKYINDDEFEDLIIDEVCKKIETLIKTIKPKNKIIIAFDGVAPAAKLKQQKNRRYKTWLTNEVLNVDKKWNSLAITPGTKFMNKLNVRVESFFKNNNKIIFSGSNKKGEGEHKLYEYIRNNQNHINEITVIYGLDSDLIMLSLIHLNKCKNIYLFRETPEFIKSIDKNLDPNTLYSLCINTFSKYICIELNDTYNEEIKNNIVVDYIFICFILGNDFIPHHPAINLRTNGLEILLNSYKKYFGGEKNTWLIYNNKIIWNNFKTLLKDIAENETQFIYENYEWKEELEKKYAKQQYSLDESSRLNIIPCTERLLEKFINPEKKYWQERYYNKLFNNNNIGGICRNYLEMLEWNLKYYMSGCYDWNKYYHYTNAPLFNDVINYIPGFNEELIKFNNSSAIHEYTQLAYVLPKSSMYLLPPNIKNEVIIKYPFFYEENYDIQWAFCKYFWEAHVIFPDLNLTELNNNICKII